MIYFFAGRIQEILSPSISKKLTIAGYFLSNYKSYSIEEKEYSSQKKYSFFSTLIK